MKRENNTFVSAAFRTNYNFREGILRGRINTGGDPDTDFDYETFSLNNNASLMANMNYIINADHKVRFTSLFVNSANQNLSEFTGINEEFNGGPTTKTNRESSKETRTAEHIFG